MKIRQGILGLLGVFLFVFVFTGCGGSGSAGFDAGSGSSGFEREQAVIAEVAKDKNCKELEGTKFCAEDADDNANDTTTTPRVRVQPQSNSDVSCVIQVESGNCTLVVNIFNRRGLQPETVFLLAVRYKNPFSSSWEIIPSRFVPLVSNPFQLETIIPVRGLSTGATGKIDLAVLAYTSNAITPLQVEPLLSRFKANVAVVVTDVTVSKAP